MDRYIIDGLVDATLSQEGSCAFVALKTRPSGEVGLAIPPNGLQHLALTFLKLLADGTSQGTFPPHLLPMMQPTTNLRPNVSGVEVDFDLSDGLRIGSEMPWPIAREFAEKLIALCNEHDAGSSQVN